MFIYLISDKHGSVEAYSAKNKEDLLNTIVNYLLVHLQRCKSKYYTQYKNYKFVSVDDPIIQDLIQEVYASEYGFIHLIKEMDVETLSIPFWEEKAKKALQEAAPNPFDLAIGVPMPQPAPLPAPRVVKPRKKIPDLLAEMPSLNYNFQPRLNDD